MGDLPLHPAVVHVPLGLGMVIPMLALWALVGVWRGSGSARWGVIGFLQVVLVAVGFFAMSLGTQDEERVERVVPESAIEAHEESAQAFVWSGVVALVLSVLTIAVRRGTRWLAVVALAATLVTAGLAVRAGSLGGELIFKHGAASAYVKAPAGAVPDRGGGHDDDD